MLFLLCRFDSLLTDAVFLRPIILASSDITSIVLAAFRSFRNQFKSKVVAKLIARQEQLRGLSGDWTGSQVGEEMVSSILAAAHMQPTLANESVIKAHVRTHT